VSLQQIREFLKMGSIVFVVSDKFQHVVSPQSARAALVALRQLRRGENCDKTYRFPDAVRAQLLAPLRLVKER
jgi:hypothetical protein